MKKLKKCWQCKRIMILQKDGSVRCPTNKEAK